MSDTCSPRNLNKGFYPPEPTIFLSGYHNGQLYPVPHILAHFNWNDEAYQYLTYLADILCKIVKVKYIVVSVIFKVELVSTNRLSHVHLR